MASLFDYIYTCDICGEQHESEGKREVEYKHVVPLDWALKDGELSVWSSPVQTVCQECWGDEIDLQELFASAWLTRYLVKFELQKLAEDGYFMAAPFPVGISIDECLQVARQTDSRRREKIVRSQIEVVLKTLKALKSNPDCDFDALTADVAAALSPQ